MAKHSKASLQMIYVAAVVVTIWLQQCYNSLLQTVVVAATMSADMPQNTWGKHCKVLGGGAYMYSHFTYETSNLIGCIIERKYQ